MYRQHRIVNILLIYRSISWLAAGATESEETPPTASSLLAPLLGFGKMRQPFALLNRWSAVGCTTGRNFCYLSLLSLQSRDRQHGDDLVVPWPMVDSDSHVFAQRLQRGANQNSIASNSTHGTLAGPQHRSINMDNEQSRLHEYAVLSGVTYKCECEEM